MSMLNNIQFSLLYHVSILVQRSFRSAFFFSFPIPIAIDVIWYLFCFRTWPFHCVSVIYRCFLLFSWLKSIVRQSPSSFYFSLAFMAGCSFYLFAMICHQQNGFLYCILFNFEDQVRFVCVYNIYSLWSLYYTVTWMICKITWELILFTIFSIRI